MSETESQSAPAEGDSPPAEVSETQPQDALREKALAAIEGAEAPPQEPVQEAKPEEPKPEVDEADVRLAVLARKQRELRAREQRVAAVEEQAQKYQRIQQLKAEGKHADALRELGIEYESVTKDLLGRDPTAEKLAAIEAELNRYRQANQYAYERQRQQSALEARTAFLADVVEEAKKTPDLELVAVDPTGPELVWDAVNSKYESYCKKHGEQPDLAQIQRWKSWAMNVISKTLEERTEAILQTSRFRGRLASVNEKAAPDEPPRESTGRQPKTLTNAQASGAPAKPRSAAPSTEELRQRALELLTSAKSG